MKMIKVLSVDVLLVSLFVVSYSNTCYASPKANLTFATPDGWSSAVFLTYSKDLIDPVREFTVGENVYLNVSVRNSGTGRVPKCSISHELLDLDGKVIVAASASCGPLDGGESVAVRNLQWKEASSLPVGKYLYRCVIDRPDAVVEDKSDNVCAFEIEIVKRRTSLVCLERSVNEMQKRMDAALGDFSKPFDPQSFDDLVQSANSVRERYVQNWVELLSKDIDDSDSGNHLTYRKVKRAVLKAKTARQLFDCEKMVFLEESKVRRKYSVSRATVPLLQKLLSGLSVCRMVVFQHEGSLPSDQRKEFDYLMNQELAKRIEQAKQEAAFIAQLEPPPPIHLTPVDTSITLPKKIRSMSHCDIHGYDYDLAQGCPGCKGNVDYGGGKTMRCNRHNVNYNSKLGCPWCAWPR